ncbi:MAG: 4Fe-4S dicluster domain-containing protein [Myxococcota bacterium]
MTDNTKPQWSSYEELDAQQQAQALTLGTTVTTTGPDEVETGADDDVPVGRDGQAELTMDGVSRRTFIGVMGAGAALAGVGLSGCIRKPVTPIVPHRDQPEDFVPGKPVNYATAYQAGVTVQGLLVESHDGRPTKIEGNPAHPESLGATSASVQGSVLGLYDLDRSVEPRKAGGTTVEWEAAWADFDAFAKTIRQAPVAVVTGAVMSPTERRLLAALKQSASGARFFVVDALYPYEAFAAGAAVGGPGAYSVAHLEHADVVAAFDCDFLGTEHSSVRNTKGFSARRRIAKPGDPMNRLYSVEASFSITGAMADHRLRAGGATVGHVLSGVAKALQGAGISLPADLLAKVPNAPAGSDKFIAALAKDLAGNKGKSAVLVGYRQPAWVHALAAAINEGLGASGQGPDSPVTWHQDAVLGGFEGPAALAQALGSIANVLVLGANPVQAIAGGKAFEGLLKGKTVVHAGLYYDETAKLATLHLPVSHYLEAWGDLTSLTGATAIVQPLIAPLHHTPSLLEVLARAATGKAENGYELVRETWQAGGDFSEKTWRRWLHDGLVERGGALPAPSLDWSKAASLADAIDAPAGGYEVDFYLDYARLDGRYANNGWLQEAPDPMTKLSWDNAALISKKLAAKLDVKTGKMVKVTVGGQSVELPVKLHPGQADNVISLVLGHGRRGVGRVADMNGFDVTPVQPVGTNGPRWFSAGDIAVGDGSYPLADIQKYGNSATPGVGAQSDFGPRATPKTSYDKGSAGYVPRPLVFEATPAEYAAQPNFPDDVLDRTMNSDEVGSLMYPERKDEVKLPGGARKDADYLNGVHQWGMSIDLNLCTGCNACMIACQAENNIPVVGKDRVIVGREMHWIRLDRYFTGSEDDPQAVLQPLPCQQCETAPCEAVCPVKATAHSPEGLNDMSYNRCIGTRYCLNNCPYKIRRFNFFQYNGDIHPLQQMQKNPDVTIRFRGVMEKCTYCVQRINLAKIEAKVHGDGKVPDGAIVTACEQVCPADAITFGNIDDPTSRVTARKSEPRTYQILRELNTRPRTTYMAKLRNTNPDLV